MAEHVPSQVIMRLSALKLPVLFVDPLPVAVLLLYSCVFMRFAWMVKPRNYLLFACHIANSSAQGVLLTRKLKYDMDHPEGPTAAAAEPIADASGAPAAVAAAAAVADVAPAKLQ